MYLLHDCIFTKIPDSVKELHLFSDGCSGQNRNHTVVRFVLALQAGKRFKKSIIIFLLAEICSFFVIRDFGTIKRNLRKYDRIYIPEEYI